MFTKSGTNLLAMHSKPHLYIIRIFKDFKNHLFIVGQIS